jgi:hypothetical protein
MRAEGAYINIMFLALCARVRVFVVGLVGICSLIDLVRACARASACVGVCVHRT